jgi:hypothetical protein
MQINWRSGSKAELFKSSGSGMEPESQHFFKIPGEDAADTWTKF